MRTTSLLNCTIACLLLAGCSSIDVIAKKQMETDARLEKLLQVNAAQDAKLADLSRELQDMKGQLATQSSDLGDLRTGQQAIKADMESTRQALAPQQTAAALPAATTVQVVADPPAKGQKEAGDQDAYMKAFGLFSANRYPEAVTAFTAFIAAYPSSEFASNAQYWIGECHYAQKDFQQAQTAFAAVLERYPKGKKVPDAMLKVAFSQISLNNQAAAKTMLQKLIDTYPKSPAAAKARERLGRL
jgi:tol-pal system protein YbgF